MIRIQKFVNKRVLKNVRNFYLAPDKVKKKNLFPSGSPLLKFRSRRRKLSQDRFWLKEQGEKVVSCWYTGGVFDLQKVMTHFEEKESEWTITPHYFSSKDCSWNTHEEKGKEEDAPRVLHIRYRRDFANHNVNIFAFESGAIVSWGIPGHLREKVENLLHPFHTDQGWPAPFEIKVPIWRKKLWEIKYKERDFSIFDASKDPVRSLKRSDFDLDWQYVDSFHMPSSFSQSRNFDSSGGGFPHIKEERTFQSVSNWSVNDVSAWLKNIGLEDMVEQFRREGIDGEVLRSITHDESTEILKEMSISKQKRLQKELTSIRGNRNIFTADNQIIMDDSDDIDVLLSISLALAQAAQLHVYNLQLAWLHDISTVLTQQLRDHADTCIGEKDAIRLVGYMQCLRHDLENNEHEPNITDTPSFLWDMSHVEKHYNAAIAHLDFNEDLQNWRTKFDIVKENIADDRNHSAEKYVARLELYIVVILVIELLKEFGILHLIYVKLYPDEIHKTLENDD